MSDSPTPLPRFWGELPFDVVRTPVLILRAAAQELPAITHGVLTGDVRVVDPFVSGEPTFRYELAVVAPALNHYRWPAVVVEFPAEGYPATLAPQWLDARKVECADEEALVAALRQALAAKGVRTAIHSLIAQSKS